MEQVLIGQNAGVIWHILDGKRVLNFHTLKGIQTFRCRVLGCYRLVV